MAAPYTTWRGLTDRRFTGRHLPPAAEYTKELPGMEDVLELFRRPEGKDPRATDTSLLFPFFAQWFTDSFLRTKWKPTGSQDFAENESNHEIDLCQIYGTNETHTSMLREHQGGRLKSQDLSDHPTLDNKSMYPAYLFRDIDGVPKIKQEYEGLYTQDNFNRVYHDAGDAHKRNAFAVGLEHGNSTIGNTLMNVLFLREHNRIAGILEQAHPEWDDERVFQTARNVNIVLLLKIVIGDYIVHIAPVDFPIEAVPGMAERESWYRTNWITVEVALLYRWHDLIPATVRFDNQEYDSSSLRRNNALLFAAGIEKIILDASQQLAGRIGLGNTPGFLLDAQRSSIAMARACQLQPYNAYRTHYGLDPVRSFEELTKDETWAGRLKEIYGTMDQLEWFVGIFAEAYGEREMMGELLSLMVGNDAFTQALTNPLLAKAVYNADTFSSEGLEIIEQTRRLADVIVRNTDLSNPEEVGFAIRRPAAS